MTCSWIGSNSLSPPTHLFSVSLPDFRALRAQKLKTRGLESFRIDFWLFLALSGSFVQFPPFRVLQNLQNPHVFWIVSSPIFLAFAHLKQPQRKRKRKNWTTQKVVWCWWHRRRMSTFGEEEADKQTVLMRGRTTKKVGEWRKWRLWPVYMFLFAITQNNNTSHKNWERFGDSERF